jgi:hypothetical protein
MRRNLVWGVNLKDDTNFTVVSVGDRNKEASSPKADKAQYGHFFNSSGKGTEYSHRVMGAPLFHNYR